MASYPQLVVKSALGGFEAMSLSEVLQEISKRRRNEIKTIQAAAPRGGGRDGAIGKHLLDMARECCDAIADACIETHLESDTAPSKEELDAVERRMKDTVKGCFQPTGDYHVPASIGVQIQDITPGPMYKIRNAFVGFKAKNRIGF